MTIIIAKDFEYEIKIKKSRFICQMKRIQTEEEAKDFILSVKKKHYKANHNCSVFILEKTEDHQEIQRVSDDGEPSGTAGVPMLEVLKKQEITNVCVIVTRYFGGIKLGASGLIRAYSSSVAETLDKLELVELVEQQELQLYLDYSLFDSLLNFLPTKSVETEFTDKVSVTIYLNESEVFQFIKELTERFNGKVDIKKGRKQFVEVTIKKS
ncbi:MAG: YigZ family protein [Lactovum sp.]